VTGSHNFTWLNFCVNWIYTNLTEVRFNFFALNPIKYSVVMCWLDGSGAVIGTDHWLTEGRQEEPKYS
jgi:hypothetical protein